jgi:hypothetical protein
MRASVVFLRRTGALYGDNARDRMQGPQAPFLMADPAASRLEYPLHPGTRTTPRLDAAIPKLPRNRNTDAGIFRLRPI